MLEQCVFYSKIRSSDVRRGKNERVLEVNEGERERKNVFGKTMRTKMKLNQLPFAPYRAASENINTVQVHVISTLTHALCITKYYSRSVRNAAAHNGIFLE